MFSLASGIYQSYFATPQLTVLLLGAEDVGKTTLLERLKVTQFSKQPKAQPGQIKRSLSCPAPPKYANAKVLDEDDSIDSSVVIPESSLGSISDRPTQSKRWLDARQQSSLEDIEWSNTDASSSTRKNNGVLISEKNQEQPLPEMKEEEATTSSAEGAMEEYNVKPGQKMLPMVKIRPTSGQNLAKIDICGAKCHIFDISGKFSDLWERYYGDAEAVIYCWHLQKGEEEQRELLETVRTEIPDDVPILIFGHVLSLDTELPTMSSSFFLPNYHSNLMQVYCGNAKNGKGVREAMEWLVPMAKRQAKLRAQAAAARDAAAAAAAEVRAAKENGVVKSVE